MPRKQVHSKPKSRRQIQQSRDAASLRLRIIGGHFRGRELEYSGDPRTRPMKDRVREAMFNLVGPAIRGKQAIDLFAGTGAIGLEALSRGAARATFFERHFPTAAIVRKNIATLQLQDRSHVVAADTFVWITQELPPPDPPWAIFCSPPYSFYQERSDEMLTLIDRLMTDAPPESLVVVEADGRFDFQQLPSAEHWDVRPYPPAVLGICRIEG